MIFIIDREALLRPLQVVQGVVERRQTLPILANVLLAAKDETLNITATDMEVELVARTVVQTEKPGEITVPARKFMDICRALPPEARIEFSLGNNRATIRSGRSRFNLSTLPASDYPCTDMLTDVVTLSVEERALRQLIELTHFAMAHQDVRYYLNGLLLEINAQSLRTVATDGHRLAMAELKTKTDIGEEPRQIIIPRKGVGELLRMLGRGEGEIDVGIGHNGIQITFPDMRFTSKLIDGRFPEYADVIPNEDRCDKEVIVDREVLQQSLARASILSNEKYRAVRLQLGKNILRLIANNPEHEEAEDELDVSYTGEALEIGFSVSYLIDAVGVVPTKSLRIYLTDASSSCLIKPEGRDDCQYVIMPMRL